ncbi:MAG: sensor histidine kinase [Lachnospiraceae bacterium]|nr:sensor histidine kinase [Lachnospiraceae bacterium]
MLRTVLMAFFSMAVGYIVLVFLIDGVLQDSFPTIIIHLLMKFGMDRAEANRFYGTVFMQNKGLFMALGFIVLFLIFFYLAMSKVTSYLNNIGAEIENILSDSEAPVTLEPELKPISEKLNTLKMTLKRREYEAMESEQRKNDLVVFLAHDLKTPLTSIIAYLTMLDEQPELSEEDREKYIHISLEKSIRLGELISEFFEITRFNLQDIVLQKETLDISMMLEQLADESYAVLAEKSLTCSIHTDDNLLVDADPDKLARVFDNLLRNAIAYSYPGTNIDIRAFGEQKDIIITFSNQGDQIPPQKLNFIFEKFYRVDNARQSRTGGAGLGLSIAKEIVELHGGAIAASSSPVCTRFTVKLPRHEEEHPAAAKKWGRIAKNGGKE